MTVSTLHTQISIELAKPMITAKTKRVTQLNVEIPVSLHAQLKKLAARDGRKVKALVAEAIELLLRSS